MNGWVIYLFSTNVSFWLTVCLCAKLGAVAISGLTKCRTEGNRHFRLYNNDCFANNCQTLASGRWMDVRSNSALILGSQHSDPGLHWFKTILWYLMCDLLQHCGGCQLEFGSLDTKHHWYYSSILLIEFKICFSVVPVVEAFARTAPQKAVRCQSGVRAMDPLESVSSALKEVCYFISNAIQ